VTVSALTTAAIYFGSFLAVGVITKLVVSRWLNLRDIDLSQIRVQLGPNRRKTSRFLLGFWRKEDLD
jgi:hypothetical protein